MSISNTNPQPKDVVILQRNDLNTVYGETHISGSNLLIYIDSDGYVNADNSSSFYNIFPPPSIGGGGTTIISGSKYNITASNAISASWANISISSSYSNTSSLAISASWAPSIGGNSISSSWASSSLSSSYVPNKVDVSWGNNQLSQSAKGIALHNFTSGVDVFNTVDDIFYINSALNLNYVLPNFVLVSDEFGNVEAGPANTEMLGFITDLTSPAQSQFDYVYNVLQYKQDIITSGSTYQITASRAISASWAPFNGTNLTSGSTYNITASRAISASWAPFNGTTLVTASTYQITSSVSIKSINSISSSWASSSLSSSYVPNKVDVVWDDGNFELQQSSNGLTLHDYADDLDVFRTDGGTMYITNLNLNSTTPNSVLVTDDSENVTTIGVTSTELSYLSNASSSIQIQLDNKQNRIVSGSSFNITSSNTITASKALSSSWSTNSNTSLNGAFAWAHMRYDGNTMVSTSYNCNITRSTVGSYYVTFINNAASSMYAVMTNCWSGSQSGSLALDGLPTYMRNNSFTMSVTNFSEWGFPANDFNTASLVVFSYF